MPTLKTLYAKYKNDGLVVLAVHSDPDTKSAIAAAKEEAMPYPVTFDGGQLMDALKAEYFPTFMLIDKKGNIRKAELDLMSADSEIEKLLKEG